MNLPMSNIIRRLRRERDITQEELAGAIGVTYQSVSRWENGQAYPDMELIPKIAQFFDISTDILFGTDSETVGSRIKAHYQKIKEVENDPEKFYQACKTAYDEFPKEFSFGLWLCRCYIDHSIKPYKEHLDEIRDICQNIMDNCTNEDFRIEAMHTILIAENEENIDKWLNMMPCWKSCKEILLETRYSYHNDLEKCRLQRQENFVSFLGYIFYNCIGRDNLEDAADSFKMALKIIDIMRNPIDDIDAWITIRADLHLRLSGVNFTQGNCEEGYIELEKAIDLYVKYAKLPIDTILSYNCPALNVLTVNKLSKPEDDTNDNGEYVCYCAYNDLLNSNSFNRVQSDERFKNQIERLLPYLPKQ